MDVIWKGAADQPLLALTIDDFPASGAGQTCSGTMALLDQLQRLAIPATFFAIGERVKHHPGMTARAVGEGHELGNHLWDEGWCFSLGKRAFLEQLDATGEAIASDLAAGGRCTPLRWFRPSGGWLHPAMVGWARSRGYRTVLGSVWPLDGLPLTPPEPLQRWIVQRLAHPGAILVLHDGSKAGAATRRSLGVVVPALQRRGFRFVTLSGLLACGLARRRVAGRREGLSP